MFERVEFAIRGFGGENKKIPRIPLENSEQFSSRPPFNGSFTVKTYRNNIRVSSQVEYGPI